MASAYDRLLNLETDRLKEFMLGASAAHAAMCAIASDQPDPHASPEEMKTRIASMSKESLAEVLAPLVELNEAMHEHHEEHGQH